MAPLSLLLRSIPYNAYSWMSLLLLFAVLRWEIFVGPMARAERMMSQEREPSPSRLPAETAPPQLSLRRAIAPFAVLFGSFFLFVAMLGAPTPSVQTGFFQNFIAALSRNEIPWLLNLSALSTWVFVWIQKPRVVSHSHYFRTSLRGLVEIARPCLILFAAWALSRTLQDLGLARSLGEVLDARTWNLKWLPALSFLAACGISFVTGTSWGTLGLLMPLALPLVSHENALVHAPVVIGAIFGGAVFGDHCSPLSDTTVVSAFASGCDVRSHVRSQLPYALIAAVLALVLVYVPYAWL